MGISVLQDTNLRTVGRYRAVEHDGIGGDPAGRAVCAGKRHDQPLCHAPLAIRPGGTIDAPDECGLVDGAVISAQDVGTAISVPDAVDEMAGGVASGERDDDTAGLAVQKAAIGQAFNDQKIGQGSRHIDQQIEIPTKRHRAPHPSRPPIRDQSLDPRIRGVGAAAIEAGICGVRGHHVIIGRPVIRGKCLVRAALWQR